MNPAARTRIVIALAPHQPGRAGLEAALILAGDESSELHGVFVEDVNVLRLCGLPAREVVFGTAEVRVPGAAALLRQVRARMAEVQRRFGEAAAAVNRPHSFEVLRGLVHEELARVAEGAELLVIGRSRRTPERPAGGGALERLLAARPGDIAFVPEEGLGPPGPVLYVDDGGRAAARAAVIAMRAGRRALPLNVTKPDASRLAAGVRLAGAQLLVVPSGWLTAQEFTKLLGELRAALLIVGAATTPVGAPVGAASAAIPNRA